MEGKENITEKEKETVPLPVALHILRKCSFRKNKSPCRFYSVRALLKVNLPLTQVPVHRDRHDRRQTALPYPVSSTQSDAKPLGLRLTDNITVDVSVNILRLSVCTDAVERRTHAAHPCRIGGIVGVHLLLLRVPAPVDLYRVTRQPCNVRHGRKHQQRIDLCLRHHNGRCLYRIGLHRRVPASRTDEPAQGEAGYTYYYIR